MIKWLNTPLEDVIQATKNLYGDIDCSITINQILMKEEKAYGMTTFADDGVYIELDAEQSYSTMMETLAHELAHVVVGPNHEHDKAWETAFNNIFDEYNRYGKEKYKESEDDINE